VNTLITLIGARRRPLSRSDASALELVTADSLTIEIRSDVGQRRLERGKGPVAIFALCALALGLMPREQATAASKEKFSREPKKIPRGVNRGSCAPETVQQTRRFSANVSPRSSTPTLSMIRPQHPRNGKQHAGGRYKRCVDLNEETDEKQDLRTVCGCKLLFPAVRKCVYNATLTIVAGGAVE
jgi:hypothetical protein